MGRRRNIRNVRGKQYRDEHGKFEKGTILSPPPLFENESPVVVNDISSDGEIEELVDDDTNYRIVLDVD